MWRGLLLPEHGSIGAFLDRVFQQRPKSAYLRVFQPRLSRRLQGHAEECPALLRQLLEDTVAIRVARQDFQKSISERRVYHLSQPLSFCLSFFLTNFQPKRNRATSFQRFLNANRHCSQLTLIARIYRLHTPLAFSLFVTLCEAHMLR